MTRIKINNSSSKNNNSSIDDNNSKASKRSKEIRCERRKTSWKKF